jgi:heme exporter protein C
MTDTNDRDAGRIPATLAALALLSAMLLAAALYAIFFVAPLESRMGIVQKIFFFHVPSAYAMYLCYAACAVGSAVYLTRRDPRWDALALSGAEVGSLFCVMVLITGPLWARKAWGVYWTWDPRLTTTLLSGMIFFAYLLLRSFGNAGEVERRFAAILAVAGALNLPVVHFSVRQWRGMHPAVITGSGGGLDPAMRPALVLGFALFTALGVLLVWMRVRAELLRQQQQRLESLAAEHGLLEEMDG